MENGLRIELGGKPVVDGRERAATALWASAYCLCVAARCAWRAVDRAAHRWPWAFIVATLLSAVVADYVGIASARGERDAANHAAYTIKLRLDSMEAAYGRGARP